MTQPLTIHRGDCRKVLPTLPSASVDCVVTSPPYWNLRDYGTDDQIGREPTVAEFVETMVAVFREVRRVMTPTGTLWLNLGDSYAAQAGGAQGETSQRKGRRHTQRMETKGGLPRKNLVGVPWRVAFALQDDGWILRQDIIWHKPNPMPESVADRCTKAHEYIFLLTASQRYYYDAKAIEDPVTGNAHARAATTHEGDALPYLLAGLEATEGKPRGVNPKAEIGGFKTRQNASFSAAVCDLVETRNKRSVWTVPTTPFPGAHFATFPPDLIRPCIRAGCPAGGVVLDPFGGSGTTGMVAIEEGRKAVLIESNPEFADMAAGRADPARIHPTLGI